MAIISELLGEPSTLTVFNSNDYIRRRKVRAEERPQKVFASRPSRPNKLVRFKNATLNWLNGLPPTDYDSALYSFDADRRLEPSDSEGGSGGELDSLTDSENLMDAGNASEAQERKKRKFFRRKLKKLRKLFGKGSKDSGQEFINDGSLTDQVVIDFEPLEGKFGDEEAKTAASNYEVEAPIYIETHPSYREIFLPPDIAGQRRLSKMMTSLTPKMRKKFAERHPWTVSNEIRTAKYTFLNFVPKNLFEQFRRVANVYFLILIILQGIPIFSNTNIILAASPLLSILIATAIKDAVEDRKRHKSDIIVNHTITLRLSRGEEAIATAQEQSASESVLQKGWRETKIWWMKMINRGLFRHEIAELNGQESASENRENYWKQAYWKDIRVGDVLLIRNNESIPADLVVVSTSDSQGICYVETKNLDGETNLKIRQAPNRTAGIRSVDEAAQLSAVLQIEPPSTRLYAFNGKIVLPREIREAGEIDAEALSLNNENLLLRGCQLRNTEFVIGVVVYTGIHSKIIMNSGQTPSKRSRIERQMNPQIILSFVLLFAICMTCAIVQGLFVGGSISSAPYWVTVYRTGIWASPIFTGFLTFWSSLILFQTLVPISLYITVEFCKLVQAAWINLDLRMYYPERDQRAVPRSWNIADDLGQIEYIFSDKTGTLTRNIMEFRRCSIGGKVYGYLPQNTNDLSTSTSMAPIPLDTVKQEQFDVMEEQLIECLRQVLPYNYVPPTQMSFVDPALITDLLGSSDPAQSEAIRNFFFWMIICHTILIDKLSMDEEVVENATNVPASKTSPHLLQYQAQSPDEAALVKAARDLGFVFMGRDHNTLKLCILGELQDVEVLNVIEFNSTRKRMSVVIKKRDGSIWLVCKGADSVIYERLKRDGACLDEEPEDESLEALGLEASEASSQKALKHLEKFAESGLRTLCFSSRQLTLQEYEDFAVRYGSAACAFNNREMLMDAVAEEYEKELTFLGATAIEDRLQDGVPEAISTLQMAGIKIWVLTGDKMETAVNIGFSCKLLNRNMFLIMIKAEDSSVEGTKRQLNEGYRRLMSFSSSMSYFDSESPYDAGTSEGGTVDYALIIDGVSLKHALDDLDCRPVFLDLATNCRAVLCCRVSPLQKAKVVELVKKTRNVMTLAIGDGANDVSMIQEADVGVGIAGEEGMQAVMSSDYAIAQFKYLQRLLLVHGRLSYVRTAKITLLCFCKNVSFVLVAFWFQIYCAFTAQYTYDYMFLLFFNMLFTMLPVLLIGIFDTQVNSEKLERLPQLYQDGIGHRYYSMRLFGTYTVIAVYQSLVCYFLPQWIFQDTAVITYGFPESKTMIGTLQAITIIIAINLFICSHMERWNWIFLAGLGITLFLFLGVLGIYLIVPLSDLYGSWGDFLAPRFWAAFVLTLTVTLLPTLLFPFIRGWIWKPKARPTDIEVIREIEVKGTEENAQDLYETVNQSMAQSTLNAQQSNWTRRGDERLEVPEKAVTAVPINVAGRRVRTLTSSSNEFVPEAPTQDFLPEPRPTSFAAANPESPKIPGSSLKRRIQKNLRFFNLRTGRLEDAVRGYAFSQDSGSARTVLEPEKATYAE